MFPCTWRPDRVAKVGRQVLALPDLDPHQITGSSSNQTLARNGRRILYRVSHFWADPPAPTEHVTMFVRRGDLGEWEVVGGTTTQIDESDLAKELRNLLLEAVKTYYGLPYTDCFNVLQLIADGEWRLATEVLCTQLCERGITPDSEYMDLLEEIGRRTATDVKELLTPAGGPVPPTSGHTDG